LAVVATGGGLAFGGDVTGGFRALDAKTFFTSEPMHATVRFEKGKPHVP
jgi:hypothetical protein